MNTIKVYSHPRCGTCKKALRFLKEKKINHLILSLEECSVSEQEIKKALEKYDIKKLFNTSGQEYRKRNLKENLKTMNISDKINLLTQCGLLVKRPFLIQKDDVLVGFKQEEWDNFF